MLSGLALGTGAPLLLKGRQRTTTLMFPPPDAMVCWGSPSARRGGAWVRVCSCVQSGGAMRGYGGFIEGGGGGADATRERGAWVGGLGRRDVDKLLYRPWLAPAAAGKLDPCVRARPGRRRLALFAAQNNFHPLTPTPRRPHIPQTAPTRSFHCAPAMPTAPAASPSPRAHV